MADDIILGAKQFPNPTGIKPQLDTDPAPFKGKPPYVKMDISNPPTVWRHPLEEHISGPRNKHFRHPLGRQTPKVTEN